MNRSTLLSSHSLVRSLLRKSTFLFSLYQASAQHFLFRSMRFQAVSRLTLLHAEPSASLITAGSMSLYLRHHRALRPSMASWRLCYRARIPRLRMTILWLGRRRLRFISSRMMNSIVWCMGIAPFLGYLAVSAS